MDISIERYNELIIAEQNCKVLCAVIDNNAEAGYLDKLGRIEAVRNAIHTENKEK